MSVRKIPSIIRTKIAKVFEAYSYAGELREVDFLSHFFDLDKMPSKDMRFKTAREEIEKHTCDSNQGDYDTNWVFSDTRFNLNSCSMELYINFLLYIFSPEVRQYGWENCLESVNCELRKCEFELYEKDIVYDESVIGIRSYPSGPFSMRYSKSKLKLLEPLITADVRQTLYDAIGCCDVYQTVLDHPNAPFRGTSTFEECIKSLFEGKCIDSDSDDMQHIFFSCRPEIIFDIIEYCFDDRYDNLREKINYCLRTNHIPLKLLTREFTWCRNENYGDIIEEIPNDADFLAATESIQKMKRLLDEGDYSSMMIHAVTALDSILKVMDQKTGENSSTNTKLKTRFNMVLKAYGLDSKNNDRAVQILASHANGLIEALSTIRNEESDSHGKVGSLPVYSFEQAKFVYDITISLCNFLCQLYEKKIELTRCES